MKTPRQSPGPSGPSLFDLRPVVKPLDGAAGSPKGSFRPTPDGDDFLVEEPVEGRFTPPVNWISDQGEDA